MAKRRRRRSASGARSRTAMGQPQPATPRRPPPDTGRGRGPGPWRARVRSGTQACKAWRLKGVTPMTDTRHALAHPFCFSQRIIKSYSFFPAVGGSGLGRAPHPHRCHSDHTLRAGRGFLLRCIAWATTLSLRHRNQHYRTTTCPHTGCHVSTIYFPHPPIAPLNLIPQKPQRISPLIARR